MSHNILGKEVGPIGYGMMGLTWFATTSSTEEEKLAALKTAVEAGATSFNGGEFYGSTLEENSLTLLRKYYEKYPEDAGKISLNIKGGAHLPIRNDNSPAYVRQSLEHCLSQLGPVGRIDMFEMARRVSQDDFVESLRVIDSFVQSGRVGGVALSEVNAATIRQASKAIKSGRIAGVEIELSLFETGALRDGVIAACAELDVPIFAYSPLGRGFLTGQITRPEDVPAGSFSRVVPKMQEAHFAANMRVVEAVKGWAERKGCTPAQFAINWVASLSGRPGFPSAVIPIPGAVSPGRIRENSAVVPLTPAEMDEVDEFLAGFEVSGARFTEAMASHMLDSNTETEV